MSQTQNNYCWAVVREWREGGTICYETWSLHISRPLAMTYSNLKKSKVGLVGHGRLRKLWGKKLKVREMRFVRQSCKCQGRCEEADNKGKGIKGCGTSGPHWLYGKNAGGTFSLKPHQPEVQVLLLEVHKPIFSHVARVWILLYSRRAISDNE